MKKNILKYIFTFIILIIILNIMMYIVSLIPSRYLKDNVKESSEILLKEGNHYKILDNFNVINNNYTDALIINEAFSIDFKNPMYSYMSMRKNYDSNLTKAEIVENAGELISVNKTEEYDPVGELSSFINGDIDTSIIYARYWHGYMVFYRILLIFFNISQIRIFLFVLFSILILVLGKLLKDKLDIVISIIYVYALIVNGYFFVAYSLESTPVFLVMMFSSIILLKKINKIKNFNMYMFIIGCITNFVDFLTVPLITLASLLYIILLYDKKNDNNIKFKEYMKLVISWGIGYSITWLSKWIIYSLLYDNNLIFTVSKQVIHRTGIGKRTNYYKLLELLFHFLTGNILYILLFCGIVLCINVFIIDKVKLQIKNNFKNNILIFITSFMPIIWYIVLINHSIQHHVFVYRHMLIFVIGILLVLKNSIYVIKIKGRIE